MALQLAGRAITAARPRAREKSGAFATQSRPCHAVTHPGKSATAPVVAEGRVYFGADDYRIHALDFATGEPLWSFATQDIVEAPPLVSDG
ncbi:MAG: PQQ-binding-like beta-propeller repeat protein, partial [Pseudomonadota bacterium]